MSHTSSADLKVAEAVETLLKGFRLSPDPELARAAAEREIKLLPDLKRLRLEAGQQKELNLRVHRPPLDDEEIESLAASGQPAGGKR